MLCAEPIYPAWLFKELSPSAHTSFHWARNSPTLCSFSSGWLCQIEVLRKSRYTQQQLPCFILPVNIVHLCGHTQYRRPNEWSLAHCDTMSAPCTSQQVPHRGRHSIYLAPPQCYHSASGRQSSQGLEPFGPWKACLFIRASPSPSVHTVICTTRSIFSLTILGEKYQRGKVGGSLMEYEAEENSTWRHNFMLDTGKPEGLILPMKAKVRLCRLRRGDERFRSKMHRWGLEAEASCVCSRGANRKPRLIILPTIPSSWWETRNSGPRW